MAVYRAQTPETPSETPPERGFLESVGDTVGGYAESAARYLPSAAQAQDVAAMAFDGKPLEELTAKDREVAAAEAGKISEKEKQEAVSAARERLGKALDSVKYELRKEEVTGEARAKLETEKQRYENEYDRLLGIERNLMRLDERAVSYGREGWRAFRNADWKTKLLIVGGGLLAIPLVKPIVKGIFSIITAPFRFIGKRLGLVKEAEGEAKKGGGWFSKLLIAGVVGLGGYMGYQWLKGKFPDLFTAADAIAGAAAKGKEAAGNVADTAKEKAGAAVDATEKKVMEVVSSPTFDAAATTAGEVGREQLYKRMPSSLLRIYGDDAEQLQLPIFEQSTQDNVAEVLRELHHKNVKVRDLRALPTDESQAATALFTRLFSDQTSLRPEQKESKTRACQFVLRLYRKHEDRLLQQHAIIHGSQEGFDDLTFDQALDLLAEGPMKFVGDFAALAPALAKAPWNHKDMIRNFLQESFGALKQLGLSEFADLLVALESDPAVRKQIRLGEINKVIMEIGDVHVTGAVDKITNATALNEHEKRLLSTALSRVQGYLPAVDDRSPIYKAFEGDQRVLDALTRIWKVDLRLLDALQVFSLAQRAERSPPAIIALRLKLLHILSRYDQEAYTYASVRLGEDITKTMLGFVTGALSTGDLPPGTEEFARMLEREAKNERDELEETGWGMWYTYGGAVAALGVYTFVRPVRRLTNWTLSRPLAVGSWARHWRNINFINYKRGWFFFNKKVRPASEISRAFRIPDSKVKDLRTLADKYRKSFNAMSRFRGTRGMLLYGKFLDEVGEMKFAWLKEETDLGKIAAVYDLVQENGEHDLDAARRVRQEISQAASESSRANRAPKFKEMRSAVRRAERIADEERARLRGEVPPSDSDGDLDEELEEDADTSTEAATEATAEVVTSPARTETAPVAAPQVSAAPEVVTQPAPAPVEAPKPAASPERAAEPTRIDELKDLRKQYEEVGEKLDGEERARERTSLENEQKAIRGRAKEILRKLHGQITSVSDQLVAKTTDVGEGHESLKPLQEQLGRLKSEQERAELFAKEMGVDLGNGDAGVTADIAPPKPSDDTSVRKGKEAKSESGGILDKLTRIRDRAGLSSGGTGGEAEASGARTGTEPETDIGGSQTGKSHSGPRVGGRKG